jgi:type II secretory pathway pseudopilin PulG
MYQRDSNERSQRGGFALVEVLVAGGIVAVISLVLAQMLVHQSNYVKSLEEKIESQQLEMLLSRAFSSGQCPIAGQIVNVSGADSVGSTNAANDIAKIEIASGLPTEPKIALVEKSKGPVTFSGQSLENPRVVIQQIDLARVRGVPSGSTFAAALSISIAGTKMPLRPIQVPVLFNVNPSFGSEAARTVVDCTASGSLQLPSSQIAAGPTKVPDPVPTVQRDQVSLSPDATLAAAQDFQYYDVSGIGPGADGNFGGSSGDAGGDGVGGGGEGE